MENGEPRHRCIMKKSKSEILKKIHGGQICQLIGTSVRIGIFDHLYESNQSAESLSIKLSLDPSLTRMLLLGLESLHLIQSDDNETFYLTEEGSYLAKDHQDSLSAIALYKASRPVWKSLEYLYEGIQTGICPFELAFGMPLYPYLDTHSEDFALFHQAMALYEEKSSKKILDLYDFTPFTTILDVGGGLGSFLKEILERAPLAKGALLDRPKVISLIQQISPENEITLIPGDFFEEIPKGYSLYVLRNIIHNWDDAKAIKILKNIAFSLKPNDKVLLFETLIKDDVNHRLGKFATLTMFAMNSGGKERTLEEMDALIHASGLKRRELVQTTGSKVLIELTCD